MQTQSFTDFRNHLALVMETVTRDHQSVTITKHGKPCAVLMPIVKAVGHEVSAFDAIVAWREAYIATASDKTGVVEPENWAAVRENDQGRDFSW